MHAVVVNVTIGDDADASARILREEVVPAIRQLPGVVAGYWVKLDDHHGTSIVVFESEDAARQAREQMQPPAGVTIDRVQPGEVVANI